MCMLLQSRKPGATAPGYRTRTVPRCRSRESFSLGLPTCTRFSQAAATFYTHTPLYRTRGRDREHPEPDPRARPPVCCAWPCATRDVLDGRRFNSQLSQTVCHTMGLAYLAAFTLLLGRTFILHYYCTTCAPLRLGLHGTGPHYRACRELEREHSHHPTRNRTGS